MDYEPISQEGWLRIIKRIWGIQPVVLFDGIKLSREIFRTLSGQECRVLWGRFEKQLTLKEIGSFVRQQGDWSKSVTKERVRQIESKAIRKLRHPMRSKIVFDELNQTEKISGD